MYKLVTQERWDKTKAKIDWIWKEVQEILAGIKPDMDYKTLESYRGFLIYVARTYTTLVPYLKGIPLTLDSWRPNRDDDGWKITNTLEEKFAEAGMSGMTPPDRVKPAKRLYENLVALRFLTDAEAPPEGLVRPMRIERRNYMLMFGDASGAGFGVTLWTEASTTIEVDHGVWEKEVSDSSSNVRELMNLVIKIEELAEREELHEGSGLFVFTDNFVAEQAFHNGSSKSKKLHALVQRVRKLEMNHSLFVHLVWLAGTRMIGQGTDGASRGDMSNGVLAGDSMLKHVPLHIDALERSPELRNWLSDSLPWKKQKELSFLAPEDWFDKAHWDTQLIWAPPPAIAGGSCQTVMRIQTH